MHPKFDPLGLIMQRYHVKFVLFMESPAADLALEGSLLFSRPGLPIPLPLCLFDLQEKQFEVVEVRCEFM